MTNVDNVLRSDVLDTQSEDVQEGNDVLAVGPPIEQSNPLGHEVTILSSVMLNLGYMLGAGIYSFPGAVLNSVGSIGLLLVFWLLAPLIALCGVTVYSEYASLFPKRSGARVVYLEQAYPRPRYLVPVTYAVTTVLLIYEAVTSIVFAQYALTICDVPVTPARQTTIALAVYTVAVACELSIFV
ncbi:hypothetical protein K503DRAFT_860958, partial [Rhizopogon vinicolor AM-OR11-026]